MKALGNAAALAIAAVTLCSCSTRAHVRGAPPEAGVLRTYHAPFETVRAAGRSAVAEASLSLLEEAWIDRGRWSVLAATSPTLSTRVVRIVVEDHPTDCRVWVFAERKPEVPDAPLAEELHSRIGAQLGVVARGPAAPGNDAEERYPVPLDACARAAPRAVAAVGHRALQEGAVADGLVSFSSDGAGGGRLFVALYREADRVTRVVVEASGGTAEANRDAVRAFHEALRKEVSAIR